MISGGVNGGWLIILTTLILIAAITFWVITIITAGLSVGALFFGGLALNSFLIYIDAINKAKNFDDINKASFLAWLRAGLGFLPVFKTLGIEGRIMVFFTNIYASLLSKWNS